ncbi:MAG TPA: helix-turn-helix domain-containing protein [Myxococcales bacterium]|jgi:excisionase family DNA binding protein
MEPRTPTLAIIPGGASEPEPADDFGGADDLWTVKRAAKYLGKGEFWVYRQAEAGLLPYRRIGRTLRFIPAELRAWVEQAPGKPGLLPSGR